jgi:hypothetical protein
MNPQSNMQNENNISSEKEKEKENVEELNRNNEDLLNKMNIDNTNNNSLVDEISLLKKEILEMKEEHAKDREVLRKGFEDEISLLKEQINSLANQLYELKNKKDKHNINNINNINNDIKENFNDKDSDSENNMDEDDQTFSIECLSSRLNTEILQGTEKANIDIIVRNNSNFKYPKDSFLICDNKNSLLLCEKVELNELNPREQQKVSIVFKNLKSISKGKYKCFVKLMINNKKYNSTFELTIDVLENYLKNDYQAPSFLNNNQMQNNLVDFSTTEQMVNNFKIQFQLYNNDIISDEKIENVLRKNNFDFNKAFEDLFN